MSDAEDVLATAAGWASEGETVALATVVEDPDASVYVAVYDLTTADATVAAPQVQAYLDDFMRLLEPMSNGESYQNYPRLSQTDFRERYWAEQFPKLLRIKRKYDPQNFFRYAQSVSPGPGQRWPKVPASDRIVVEPWSPNPIATPGA